MLAAYCDGCMKEVVSNDREVMVSWMSAHHDHYRTWSSTLGISIDEQGDG